MELRVELQQIPLGLTLQYTRGNTVPAEKPRVMTE